MKYHRLSNEDFHELRDEFVRFLAAHSITASDWEKIKAHDVEQTGVLLDEFSDLVIHRALTNIKSLRLVSAKEMYVFRFDEKEASVVHLELGKDSPHDLTNPDTITSIANGTLKLDALDPKMETGKKKLTGDREVEMYLLMRQGAQPCELEFFEAFFQLVGTLS
jgi:hypothetical protein